MKKRVLFFAICFILLLNIFFISAGELKVTQEHPFLIDGNWVSAYDLQIGDELTLINGSKVKITFIEDISSSEAFNVYNLEAGIYHDFVVSSNDGLDVVVHNSEVLRRGDYFREEAIARYADNIGTFSRYTRRARHPVISDEVVDFFYKEYEAAFPDEAFFDRDDAISFLEKFGGNNRDATLTDREFQIINKLGQKVDDFIRQRISERAEIIREALLASGETFSLSSLERYAKALATNYMDTPIDVLKRSIVSIKPVNMLSPGVGGDANLATFEIRIVNQYAEGSGVMGHESGHIAHFNGFNLKNNLRLAGIFSKTKAKSPGYKFPTLYSTSEQTSSIGVELFAEGYNCYFGWIVDETAGRSVFVGKEAGRAYLRETNAELYQFVEYMLYQTQIRDLKWGGFVYKWYPSRSPKEIAIKIGIGGTGVGILAYICNEDIKNSKQNSCLTPYEPREY